MNFASPRLSDYDQPRAVADYTHLTAVEQLSARILELVDQMETGQLNREEHARARIRVDALKAMLEPTKLLQG